MIRSESWYKNETLVSTIYFISNRYKIFIFDTMLERLKTPLVINSKWIWPGIWFTIVPLPWWAANSALLANLL